MAHNGHDSVMSEKIAFAAHPAVSFNAKAPEIDHVAERKLVRKLDLWIVPPGLSERPQPILSS